MKIAIISSASSQYEKSIVSIVDHLISILAKIPNLEILTGGCSGIPGLIVQKAKVSGIKTTAYSPDKDETSHHIRHDNLSLEYFDDVKHIEGFTARSLAMIQDADCVLALNGRMGTLSECIIALEEGKKVGVISNTGGIADHMPLILSLGNKQFPNQIYFSEQIEKVLDWLRIA